MTTFPMQNNNNGFNESYIRPVVDPTGRNNLSKAITNARLALQDSEIKSPNPIMIYCLSSGPAGKTSVFMKRTSGTTDGTVSIYGTFSDVPVSDNRIALVENVSWTDDFTEIISGVNNPFFALIVEYNFLGTDDTSVDLNFSFF